MKFTKLNSCEIGTIAACTFAVLVIFMLRNLEPLVFPTLYADDGGWTGLIMQHGFFHTAFNAREGFPVFGLVLLDWISWSLTQAFAQGDFLKLPYFMYGVSALFLTTVSVMPLFIFKNSLPLSIRVLLVFILPLMPTGPSGNEIYGRIGNLGYLFPLICTYGLIIYYGNGRKLLHYCGLILIFLISSLTFPVCLGMLFIWIFYEGLIGYNIYKLKYKVSTVEIFKIFLIISILILIIYIMPNNFIGYKGGATDLSYNSNGLIDYVLGRLLLYPFISKYYSHLNDFACIILSLFLIFGILLCIHMTKNSNNKKISLILFYSYLIYAISTAYMRIGFSTWFGNYENSFPDRYFYGINTLFIISIVFILYNGLEGFKRVIFVSLALTLFFANSLFSYKNIFELASPAMNWRQFGDIKTMTCNNSSDGSANSYLIEGPNVVFSIYPVLDSKNSWKMSAPIDIYNFAIKQNCK